MYQHTTTCCSEAYLPGTPILLLVQVVSTAFTTVLVKGEKGQRDMERIQIDTSTFFSILPREVLFAIGAYPEGLKTRLELQKGDSPVTFTEGQAIDRGGGPEEWQRAWRCHVLLV